MNVKMNLKAQINMKTLDPKGMDNTIRLINHRPSWIIRIINWITRKDNNVICSDYIEYIWKSVKGNKLYFESNGQSIHNSPFIDIDDVNCNNNSNKISNNDE